MRGHLEKCPVILGSATPSMESLWNAKRGKYRMVKMPARVVLETSTSSAKGRFSWSQILHCPNTWDIEYIFLIFSLGQLAKR